MNAASSIKSIETTNLDVLIEVSNKNTLILSDITETLYKPCNTMSDKKWRTFVVERIKELISDSSLASDIAKKVENMIVNQVDKELVHKNAPQIIRDLQSKEIPFLAISAKNWSSPYDPHFGITTSNHLKKLDIDLEKSVRFITPSSGQEVEKTAEYIFAKGIIFTNKKPLDNALNTFLNRLENKPEQIIILENSSEHKGIYEAVAKAHGIALTYVHHKSPDQEKGKVDPILGTIEFLQFMKDETVIRDDEAMKIKEANPSIDFEALLKSCLIEHFQ